ncbi:MAG TPA: DAK2 domain-containing protein [Limnochordales bacterium]|nr:DAK2 domain-containing protein [Limnochordales bacterium]
MAPRQLTAQLFCELMAAGAAYLEERKETVNALNVFPVPDGDTGTNMALTLAAARRELGDAHGLSLGDAAQRLARGALLGARGNSGVILSQFLRGFAQGMAGCETAGPRELAAALAAATETAYRAVIKPVEGTMLTVGRGASEAAERAVRAGADLEGVLAAAVHGAREALARTPSLLPVLARAGVVDAGGQGFVYFLEGILAAARGERVLPAAGAASAQPAPAGAAPAAAGHPPAAHHAHGAITHEHVEHRYCTEFLIRGRNLDLDVIRQHLEPLGDSLLVVGDSELVKVHVHTNHPGRALEVGTTHGELLEVSVANMQEQNRLAAQGASSSAPAAGAVAGTGPVDANGAVSNGWTKAIGVVAVAQGDGWRALLESLGVDQVVAGGQTMNPSAAELVAAIEAVQAPDVVVLPNNSNIVFTARQAMELTDRRVHVVPTRTVAAGVAAMMAYTPDGDPKTVAQTMDEAAKQVRTVEITYAVRDSEAWEVAVRAGDCIGLIDGEIRAAGPDPEATVLAALEQLVSPDDSLISIYYGQDVSEETAQALAARVRSQWPHCEVEVYAGGQPVYFYILAVE